MAATSDAARRERFDAIYQREHSNVVRFVARRLPFDDLHRAEDVASDVFLAAWRRLPQIRRDEAAERAWLYACARNCLLNEHRATARRGLHVRLAPEASDAVVAPDQAPELRLDLATAWHRLSPGEQEVLALAIWENLSSAEAGKVLGIAASAYRFRLHRARSRLRAALQLSDARQLSASQQLNNTAQPVYQH
jgi:RNA polymerase sigma-70 factor (ECF subfamily)